MNNKRGFLFIDGAIVLPTVILIVVSMIVLAISLYDRLDAQTSEHMEIRKETPVRGGRFIVNADFLDEKLQEGE
ncbi:MAG: hypothetical protein ACOX4U_00220 [Anaerovoracaceae bacterium]